MTRTINALLLGATLLLAACEAQPKTEPKDTPKPAARPIEEPPPSEPAVLSGVGPSGAEGRDARRQAALDLLTDGQTAAALPIDATGPDQKFDPRLAEKLAPKVWLSDAPSSSSHRTAKIKYKPTRVEGPLDRDIIYRMVRAHINEVRSCYNAGLSQNSKLAGRVTINFVILGTGKVGSSVLRETTLGDTTVGNCIAKAVKRWTFPKPRGGDNVIVDFAFDLSPK